MIVDRQRETGRLKKKLWDVVENKLQRACISEEDMEDRAERKYL